MHHTARILTPTAALAAMLAASLTLNAGGAKDAVVAPPAAENPGDWCTWLSNKPGTLYKGDNPWIQEAGVFGRFHWQAAYLSGEDVNGYDFSDDYTEVRRARLGFKLKFLRYFELKANANFAWDTRAHIAPWPGNYELNWGYQNFDEAYLIFDAAKAFGLDSLDELKIAYGRHKLKIGQEVHTSSRNILTVERSAIANKIYGSSRPTGISAKWKKDRWSGTAALFSTDARTRGGGNVELLGGWNDGLAYYASLGYKATDELDFLFDVLYNDADTLQGEDSLFRYHWATSLAAIYDTGRWGVIANLIYGDNGGLSNGVTKPARQGDFWGFVLMPHYWIVQDRLEGVVRYAYAGSEADQGVRANSRYFRRSHGPVVDVNSGRGDTHHSIYGGVNYYLCGHNAKLMAGVEYEHLDAPGAGTTGDVDATTLWFAVRTYF